MVDILYSIGLGGIAGLLPVYLGLLPLPLFKHLSPSGRNLLISVSIGILLFLFADVMGEAIELAENIDSGSILLTLGLAVGLLGPFFISSRRHRIGLHSSVDTSNANFFTAYMVSVGIGFHNLGEGLAIGATYAAGQIGLTAVLVIGFALHNGTEGIAISGPLSDIPTSIRQLLVLGFLAGFPTIVGSVIGSVAYSDLLGTLFFAAAAGALLFVIVRLLGNARFIMGTYTGILIGILTMYFTDLLLSM